MKSINPRYSLPTDLAMFKYALSILIIATIITSCVTSKPISTTSKAKTIDPYNSYDEDLSVVRPRYKETPVSGVTPKKPDVKRVLSDQPLHINRQLDAVVDTIAVKNRSIRYASGFRVQIYVGNIRKEADDARLYTYQAFPELNPYLVYNQPTYRVRVGDFMTRIDAERYLQQIQNRFEASVVVPEKIDLKKSLTIK